MTHTNIQICDNCKKENPLYRETCLECGHYLRKTVVNIDLWSTIWKVFESPKKAIKNVICAEHKNFVFFLLLLLSTKLYSFFIIFKFMLHPLKSEIINLSQNSLLNIGIYFFSLIIFAKFFTVVVNSKSPKLVRFKDNISIIVYSFIPIILISFILLPIEYGIFGKQWFTGNPSPIIIKKNAAYVFYGIESIMFIWSVFILYTSFQIQTGSKIKAIFFVLLFLSMIFGIVIFVPLNIIV